MSNYVTEEKLVGILDEQFKAQTEEILGVMQAFIQQVDERFNKLEVRMDNFDRKIDSLVSTIDGFLKRLDEVESEQIARDRQFERLVAWAHKVSEKTGIPLENL